MENIEDLQKQVAVHGKALTELGVTLQQIITAVTTIGLNNGFISLKEPEAPEATREPEVQEESKQLELPLEDSCCSKENCESCVQND